jgi:protein-S-isoprenylcysteine O-methyltransferase Ste14
MVILRRLILLISLMFWQGGFMFYGSVVITVGAQVLGSEMEQGFVTQAVTNYLNIAGAVSLTIWGIELWRGRIRWPGWALWLGLVLSLVGVAILHTRMDQRLEVESHAVVGKGFYSLHRVYIALSAGQWLASLGLLGVTMHHWTQADRQGAA